MPEDLTIIKGDGSDRIFYRIRLAEGDTPAVIAAFPGSKAAKDLSEARAGCLIGKHLYGQGVPVPETLACDGDHGVLLLEDCGDLNLHQVVSQNPSPRDIDRLYYRTIDGLILLQIEGRKGFDRSFCWDSVRYDMDLMLEKESGYFLSAFCHDYLGIIPDDPGIFVEFQKLARRASRLPNNYLLHRDFQSRNLLVQKDEVRIIDFQGARFGPLGYDIASLLIDPYVGLTREQEDRYLEYYISEVEAGTAVNRDEFREGYYLLTLQRSLQILGAFAYLSQIKKKEFFQAYINPALDKLNQLLQSNRGRDYPCFRRLVERIHEL
ncbi:MAG: aminoglycoside phosphotransferase family protein [Desulfobia sp.]